MPENPEHSPACTCHKLRKTARRVSRIYDRYLAACGIGIAQFGLLQMAKNFDGESVTALASRLEMDRTTLTRNLRPLERQGCLRIEAGPDRRTRAVYLTATGRALLDAAYPHWRAAQHSVAESLGGGLDALHGALDDAMDRLQPG